MSQDHLENDAAGLPKSTRRKFLRQLAVGTGLVAGGAQLLAATAHAEGEPIVAGSRTDNGFSAAAATPNEGSFLASLPLSADTKNNFLAPFLNSQAGSELDPGFSTAPNYLGTQSFDNYDVHLFKAIDGGKDVIIAGRNGNQPGSVYYSETTIYPDLNTPTFSEMNAQIIELFGQPDSIIDTGDGAKQMVYMSLGKAFEYYDDPPRFASDRSLRFINKEVSFDVATTPTLDEYKSGWATKTYLAALRGK